CRLAQGARLIASLLAASSTPARPTSARDLAGDAIDPVAADPSSLGLRSVHRCAACAGMCPAGGLRRARSHADTSALRDADCDARARYAAWRQRFEQNLASTRR